VLAWHTKIEPAVQPELARTTLQDVAYKAFWTYALQPGSDNRGNMFWATEPITLSTDLGGEADMSVDSAGASLCVEGDLNAVLENDWGEEGHLHATYHEVGTSDNWRVFYNSDAFINFSDSIYLPLILRNSGGNNEE
jgi:hypothetical protein